MNWDDIVEVRNPTEINVELLHFDISNPRFTPDKQPDDNTDAAVINKLANSADLAELVQSISASGYINIEPLIVVVRDDKLVVLEGNRRLAALKVLRDPNLATGAKLSVPEFSQNVRNTLDSILVYRVAEEDDARELIGFKHINGPQSWDAYAKAKYAVSWLDDQQGRGDEALSLLDIANRMGDKHATIHRMVTAYYVLQQAEETELYDVEDRYKKSFSFSHLYTGLSYAEFTDYLGMKRPVRSNDPERTPIREEFFVNLRQLLIWLYGSKDLDQAPVIRSKNPDLGTLKDILTSPAATRELAESSSLGNAMIAQPAP